MERLAAFIFVAAIAAVADFEQASSHLSWQTVVVPNDQILLQHAKEQYGGSSIVPLDISQNAESVGMFSQASTKTFSIIADWWVSDIRVHICCVVPL